MRRSITQALAIAAVATCLAGALQSTSAARLNADGSLELVGHRLRCDNVRTRLDKRLPNLGAASPEEGLLLINPVLLGDEHEVVQLFVFHHECGHHRVGASELGADCWAIDQGVGAGWLRRESLQPICASFGGAPETSTHPSAKRRCANLEQCFTRAENRVKKPPTPTEASVVATAGGPALVRGPRLAWIGNTR